MTRPSITVLRCFASAAAIAGLLGPCAALAQTDCERARAVLGDAVVAGLNERDCGNALRAAEEERWQVWIDLAVAHESSGDLVSATAYHQRLIDAADQRQGGLSPRWAQHRRDAAAAVQRLDAALRQTMGRVEVTTHPAGAMASFEGKAAGMASHSTPFVHYLPPGQHVLQLYHPSSDRTIDRAIEVSAAGDVVSVDLNLLALGAARQGGAMPPPGTEPPQGPPDTLRLAGTVTLTIGVAAGAAALGLWLTSEALEDNGDQGEADVFGDRALVTGLVGGAAIAAGVVMIVLGENEPIPATAGPTLRSLSPVVTGRGDGGGVGAIIGF